MVMRIDIPFPFNSSLPPFIFYKRETPKFYQCKINRQVQTQTILFSTAVKLE